MNKNTEGVKGKMKKQIIGMCPYCKKAIGLDVEISSVNIQERKVNQKTYEFEKAKVSGADKKHLAR